MGTTITKDELLQKLIDIATDVRSSDPARDHQEADEALLEYVDDPEISAAFERIEKYYA